MPDRELKNDTIIYKRGVGYELRLLLFKPESWSADDKRTAIVWIHGGGWSSGEPERFGRHCRMFAGRGAVNFSVQYRLLPQEGELPEDGAARSVEECISDCKSAIRYIRGHALQFGIHPDRIAVAGDSAGGHLAASMATQAGCDEPGEDLATSAKADLVVNCNGIVDFTGKWKMMIPQRECGQPVVNWMERHKHAQALSPLYNVAAGQPPMLIMHGLEDEVVIPEDAVRFYEAYTAAGNEAELVLYAELKHAFILFDYTAAEVEVLRALGRIDDFLVSHHFLEAR